MRHTTTADLDMGTTIILWSNGRHAYEFNLTELQGATPETLIFPGDHPAAQWIVSTDGPVERTVRSGEHWTFSALVGWHVECDHPVGAVLVTSWREISHAGGHPPPPPRAADGRGPR